jgi:hypothetical protein
VVASAPLGAGSALAGQVDCELVTFSGLRPAMWRSDGGLRSRVLRPVTWLHGRPAQPAAPLLPAAGSWSRLVSGHRLAARLGANARDLVVQRFT